MSAEVIIDGAAKAHGRAPWAGLDMAGALAVAIPAVLAFAVVLYAPQVLGDGDSWWHVAAGQWMLDHHQVVRADPFSFTFAGRPWHAQEWLAEIAMALAWRAAGWGGVLILAGLAAAGAVGVLAHALRRRLGPLPALAALALAAGCLAPSLLARPHLFMLPLLALWTTVLLDARARGRAPSLGWAGLILLWANLHASVIFALALIGPFALEALLEGADKAKVVRDWGTFGVLALLAALATPFGIDGLIYPLWLSNMASLRSIVEWRPPDFSTLQPVEVAILGGAFALLSRGVRVPPVRLAVLIGLLYMTLAHQRHQVLLAIVGGLIVAEAAGRAPRAEAGQAGKAELALPLALFAALACALALARIAAPVERRDDAVSPMAALAHVPPALRARPVLNDYGMGGYLIARGVRPFIDGRTDMYGDAFNARYDAAVSNRPALDGALKDYRIAWTIAAPASPMAALMDGEPGWRRLYTDRDAVVHIRR